MTKRQTAKTDRSLIENSLPDETNCAAERPFDQSLCDRMQEMVSLGLTPSSALDLITRLMGEIPGASKDAMDKLKMLDKLLNTARAMMETRLKTEEAAEIARRLDDMERRVDELSGPTVSDAGALSEVWHGRPGKD